MDSRRGRIVIDPKVRQVGFVTPGSEPVRAGAGGQEAGAVPPAVVNSPSPVIIPLPKNLPLQASSPRRGKGVDPGAGSYNPSDSVFGSSPAMSSRTDSNGLSSVQQETFFPIGAEKGLDGFAERLVIGDGNTETALLRVADAVSASVPAPADKGSKDGAVVAGSSNNSKAAEGDSAKTLKERTSRAERRAVQNEQRALKAASTRFGAPKAGSTGSASTGGVKPVKPTNPKKDVGSEKKSTAEKKVPDKSADKKLPSRMQFDDPQRVAKARKRAFTEQTETKNRLELFRHLPQFDHVGQLPLLEAKYFQDDVMHPHPAVYKIGLQYLTGDVVGGNARCVAMLSAFREMFQDYTTPPEKTLVRDLTARINSQVSFLIECRPLSISMGNSIKFLKTRIGKLSLTLSETEAKTLLTAEIDRFLQVKILLADKEIVRHAVTKIRDGDVLLTHGFSCVVEMILVRAHELGKKFRVVVVDSRPKLEGRHLLRKLLQKGLQCTYCQINSVSYIMQEVTRVFLGAASVLSNGTVYSRVGTACVAMVAHSLKVPVMICCETYKFHERVQLDSICSNELGDPDVLVKVQGRKDLKQLEGWEELEHLQLLNLTYDAMPAEYIAMIITELGMVPPTSVPVILREYRKEFLV